MNKELLKKTLDYAIRVTRLSDTHLPDANRLSVIREYSLMSEQKELCVECDKILFSSLFIIANELPMILSMDSFDSIQQIVRGGGGDSALHCYYDISTIDDAQSYKDSLAKTAEGSVEDKRIRYEINSLLLGLLWAQLHRLKEEYLPFLYPRPLS